MWIDGEARSRKKITVQYGVTGEEMMAQRLHDWQRRVAMDGSALFASPAEVIDTEIWMHLDGSWRCDEKLVKAGFMNLASGRIEEKHYAWWLNKFSVAFGDRRPSKELFVHGAAAPDQLQA